MKTYFYLIMIKKENQSQPIDYADHHTRQPNVHCYHRRVLPEVPSENGSGFSLILTTVPFNVISLMKQTVIVGSGIIPSIMVSMKTKPLENGTTHSK